MRAHAAGLLLLLLLVAGCGGGGLSKSQLVSKGDAICTRVNKQVAKQPDPKSTQDLARVAQAVVKVSDPAIKDMESLDASGDQKATFDKFVADLKRQRDLTKQLGDAAGKGDTAGVQKIGTKARTAQTTYRAHAKKIGFKVCGGGD
jgi:hypothetical protein